MLKFTIFAIIIALANVIEFVNSAASKTSSSYSSSISSSSSSSGGGSSFSYSYSSYSSKWTPVSSTWISSYSLSSPCLSIDCLHFPTMKYTTIGFSKSAFTDRKGATHIRSLSMILDAQYLLSVYKKCDLVTMKRETDSTDNLFREYFAGKNKLSNCNPKVSITHQTAVDNTYCHITYVVDVALQSDTTFCPINDIVDAYEQSLKHTISRVLIGGKIPLHISDDILITINGDATHRETSKTTTYTYKNCVLKDGAYESNNCVKTSNGGISSSMGSSSMSSSSISHKISSSSSGSLSSGSLSSGSLTSGISGSSSHHSSSGSSYKSSSSRSSSSSGGGSSRIHSSKIEISSTG